MAKLPSGYKKADMTKVRGRLNNPSPLDESVRKLLVRDPETNTKRKIDKRSEVPVRKAKNLSDIISNNIQAATDLRTVTHYIKRAEQIWTALLLKPNGEQESLFLYDTKNSGVRNGKLHEILIQAVKNHFSSTYPFESVVPQIIKDVLFRTGNYCIVNFSHSIVDHIINGYNIEGNESGTRAGVENLLGTQFVGHNWKRAKNIGYIRKSKPNSNNVAGIESLYGSTLPQEPEFNLVDDSLNWTFTDNPVVLKTSEVVNSLRETRLKAHSGLESIDDVINTVFSSKKKSNKKPNPNNVSIISKSDFDEELNKLYPKREYDKSETLTLKTSKHYKGNGKLNGIREHWPAGSVIPASINGELGNPFGFIFLIDPDTGEALNSVTDFKFYQTSKSRDSRAPLPKSGTMNDVISHIKQISEGGDCTEDMGWMAELTAATLEKEMTESFFNGDLHKNVSISLTDENIKLYMSRALKQQGVRAVFVPGEYVTYIAVDYTKSGAGRSLVDEAKLHITRLAALEIADILAQIENAISHTLVTIDTEEEDFDPRSLAAQIRNEYFANNPTLHDILGSNSVSVDTILDRYREQSLTIKINPGENPNIIAPQIEARQADREPLKSIDSETRNNLLNTISGYFCLKRSWLEDTGEGNDFAIEALADQELLRNQAMDFSRIFSEGCTDAIKKYISVNNSLISELVEIIQSNKKLYSKPDQPDAHTSFSDYSEEEKIKIVLVDFLNSLFVTLPTPAVTETLTKMTDKIDAINTLVDSYISLYGGKESIQKQIEKLNDTGVELDPDQVMGAIKSVFMNETFKRYNIPRPFEDIGKNGGSGGMLNIISQIVDQDANMINFLTELLAGENKNKALITKLKNKIAKENDDEMVTEPEADPESVSDDETDVTEETDEGDQDIDIE